MLNFLHLPCYLLFSCSRHPEVLWAQRSHKIYLTIALPDAKDVVIKCDPEGVFSFSATRADGESFKFDLELYGGILLEVVIFLCIY